MADTNSKGVNMHPIAYTATVTVTLKNSILDPQGQTGLQALNSLGFQNALDLRVGKYYVIKVNSANEVEAKQTVEEMCNKLLVNPVIEQIQFVKVEPSQGTSV